MPQQQSLTATRIPICPSNTFIFSRGLSLLAEKEPMKAANLVITFKDELQRNAALSSLMNTWVVSDPAAALGWAQALSNPTLHKDAIAAAVGAWAKIDPAAALAHAQGIPDDETRVRSFKKAGVTGFAASRRRHLLSRLHTMRSCCKTCLSIFHTFPKASHRKSARGCWRKFPKARTRRTSIAAVTDSQIRKGQFNQALELLNAMPDSTGRDRNVVTTRAGMGEGRPRRRHRLAQASARFVGPRSRRGWLRQRARQHRSASAAWNGSSPFPMQRCARVR